MKTSKLGVLSAVIASACCIVPLLLVLVGLGSLGIGVVIGKYHWYFIIIAVGLITYTWRSYFREKKTCSLKGCQMENKKILLTTLILSTVVVGIFVAINIYTYANHGTGKETRQMHASAHGEKVTIPVEGMTCFTCELTVSRALKKINGVIEARASAADGMAYVVYDDSKVTLEQLRSKINKTGYKALVPNNE